MRRDFIFAWNGRPMMWGVWRPPAAESLSTVIAWQLYLGPLTVTRFVDDPTTAFARHHEARKAA